MIGIFKNIDLVSQERYKQLVDIYGNIGKNIDKKIKQSVISREIATQLAKQIVKYEDIKIQKNEDGKPYFCNTNLYLSISHSNNICMVGVSENPIAVDVEKVKKYNNKIIERYFTVKEKEYISSCDNKEIAFTTIWTLKECYFKLIGGNFVELCKQNSFVNERNKIIKNVNNYNITTKFEDGYIYSYICMKYEKTKYFIKI